MRIFRLAGVVLLVMAALTMAGSGVLNDVRPSSKLSVVASAAADTRSAQASSESTGDMGRQTADRTDVGHDAEGAQTAEAPGGHDAGHEGGHGNPVVPVLALLLLIILAAKLGGGLMEKIGQPGVLGELVFGVILGNLALLGFHGVENLFQVSVFGVLPAERIVEILAELGVILLLFEIGLESNIKEMMSVGASSLLVATFGVVIPFVLGWGVGAWLLPESSVWVHVFLGATLCATSVGITSWVLKDLNRISLRESKIVLGAAVIDDIMGLVILAVVVGLVGAANTGVELLPLSVAWIVGKALLFLVGAIVIGRWGAPKVFNMAGRMAGQNLLLTTSLLILFLFSYIANKMGLATIVGAFVAGLVIDPEHYKELQDREERSLEELLYPISGFLVPIFFVYIGYKVNLSCFADPSLLLLTGALTVAAIIGKQVCSLGVLEKGLDKLSVGIGMIPRGEVGLIFASIGAGLFIHGEKMINDGTYGAVVMMVIITTLITSPALKWSMNRPRGYEGASDAEMARITAEKRQKRQDYYRNRAAEGGGRDGDGRRGRSSRGGRSRSGGGRSGSSGGRGSSGGGRSGSGEGRGASGGGRGGSSGGRGSSGGGRGRSRSSSGDAARSTDRGRGDDERSRDIQAPKQEKPQQGGGQSGGQTGSETQDGSVRRRRPRRRRRGGRGRGGASGSSSGGGGVSGGQNGGSSSGGASGGGGSSGGGGNPGGHGGSSGGGGSSSGGKPGGGSSSRGGGSYSDAT